MPDKIGILFLIDKMATGGAQRQLCILATGIDRTRFQVQVVCLNSSVGTLGDDLQKKGIPVTSLGVRRLYDPAVIKALISITRKLKNDDISIIHTWTFNPDVLGPIAGAFKPGTVVITSRRDVGHFLKHRHHQMLAQTGRLADAVVSNSVAGRDAAIRREGLHPSKCVVIYNGIDSGPPSALRPKPDKGLVIGTMGALSPRKDHVFFLRVAREVLHHHPETTFRIIGEGTLRRRIENEASRLGIEQAFEMPGEVQDTRAELLKMDIFFLSSRTEGIPNVLLEAMAAGLPCLSTRVGGVPEIFISPGLGVIVEHGDTGQAAKALCDFITSRHMRKETGKLAREHVLRRFTISKMVRSYERLYERLLKGKK